MDSDINEDQEAPASSSTITVINISGQGSSLIHNGDNYNGTVSIKWNQEVGSIN